MALAALLADRLGDTGLLRGLGNSGNQERVVRFSAAGNGTGAITPPRMSGGS